MESTLKWATWMAAALLAVGLGLTLGGSVRDAYALHAGLWLLIATPIVRVLMALAAYTRAKDWTFVALTVLVLACLAVPLARYFLSSPR